MNFGTAYIDGSGIYGATPESADKLREFDGGFLKVFPSHFTQRISPDRSKHFLLIEADSFRRG